MYHTVALPLHPVKMKEEIILKKCCWAKWARIRQLSNLESRPGEYM